MLGLKGLKTRKHQKGMVHSPKFCFHTKRLLQVSEKEFCFGQITWISTKLLFSELNKNDKRLFFILRKHLMLKGALVEPQYKTQQGQTFTNARNQHPNTNIQIYKYMRPMNWMQNLMPVFLIPVDY